MPLGLGLSPLGSSPTGYGSPDTTKTPLGAMLPDVVTALPQTGRVLSLNTGDYAFTTDGRVQGMATVPQLVQLALTEQLGSASIRTLGQRYTRVTEQGPNVVQQMTSEVNRALADVVGRGLVRIEGIDVKPVAANPDGRQVFVRWRDLTTGQGQNTPVGTGLPQTTPIGP